MLTPPLQRDMAQSQWNDFLSLRVAPHRMRQRKVLFFDGSDDPEVCCIVCGKFLGKNSVHWWDDYTCRDCHETSYY